MTEETTPTTETVEQPAAQAVTVTEAKETPVEEWDKERAKATILNLRAIESQAKKDAKELAILKAEKQQKLDAELSEADRAKKERDEFAKQNAQLQADIIRRDVVSETGLPAVFADRLKGATKEEMLEDAKELMKAIPAQAKQAVRVSASNPANANNIETLDQKRSRIFPGNANPFDAESIRAKGGGVIIK